MRTDSNKLEENVSYPRISRRIRAVLIDGVLIPIAAIGTIFVVSNSGFSGATAALSAVAMVFILEPFLVSSTGGSVGHHLVGLQIKSAKYGVNLNIFASTVRFISKIFLGLFSLFSILITKKHQAMHDIMSGSIVVLRNPESLHSYEVLSEREVEKSGYESPTVLRRIGMIVVYNLVLYVFVDVIFVLFSLENCILYSQCSNSENALLILISGSVAALIVLCWKGLLPGCRRKELK